MKTAGLCATSLATVLVALAPAAPGQDGAETDAAKEALADVRRHAQRLVQELERLQEDVVTNLAGPAQRETYRQVGAVLAEASQFGDAVKPGSTPDALNKQYAGLDRKVHALVKAVRGLGPEQAVVQRDADFVNTANEELFYALTAGGGTGRDGAAVERQAGSLLDAARGLERTAKFGLAGDLSRGVLHDDIKKLVRAAEQFRQSLDSRADAEQRRKDFTPVDQAWTKVVHGFGLLGPGEDVFLLRSAARFDRLHQRLHRLLGIEGKRPQLTVPS